MVENLPILIAEKSEFNYTAIIDRIVEDETDYRSKCESKWLTACGFLAVDSETPIPLGMLDIQFLDRKRIKEKIVVTLVYVLGPLMKGKVSFCQLEHKKVLSFIQKIHSKL